MRQEVLMPTLSDEAEEGMLVTWFVVPGARVRADQLIAEVQVEKVSAEVYAPADGHLAEILVQPGEVVPQGAPIAVFEAGAAAAVSETTPSAPPRASPPVSPSARRLAREIEVDLSTVTGSGPGGRIVEADVRAVAQRGAGVASFPRGTADVEPLSPMRRTVATRLTAGLREAAQLTLTAEVDATALATDLARLSGEWGRRAAYTEMIVRACALSLRDHPRVGSRWSEDGLVPPQSVDIGVAVSVEGGLIVPVIRHADTKNIEGLSHEIAELAERARSGQITTPETRGGTFSVTNLGAHRIDAFTPLLDLPQAAILGVGRARPRPAVVNGLVVPRTLMVLSLTIDHRVIDGDPAAAFLDRVIELLEDPGSLT
jgi:pyruvate/2-oxoglutarate dehydrogenase complex dihydrolipoamide acyltransferase (E2) component